MSRFLESIHIKQGVAELISYHQARYDNCMQYHFPNAPKANLSKLLKHAPTTEQTYKLRIEYSHKIEKIEFIPYQTRPIKSLKLIEADSITYDWKYADRSQIDALQTKTANQEIIIIQNGLVTDSSYANLVFERRGELFTPLKPLLYGVRREHLLKEGKIHLKDISIHEIKSFEYVYLINGLLSLENAPKVSTKQIF